MVEQVGEHIEQFVPGLAESEHEAALGLHGGPQPLGSGEEFERPRIDALAAADVTIEPRHRFGVVVEDVGRRLHDPLDRAGLAEEIGHEHLDDGPRGLSDRHDRALKVLGAAVGQVVAGDARDHDVGEAEPAGRLRHPLGLVDLECLRLALRHRAEPAGPRADVAENHERGRALRPALEPVGALGRGADRLEAEFGDEGGRLPGPAAGREIRSQPRRQPPDGGRRRRGSENRQ